MEPQGDRQRFTTHVTYVSLHQLLSPTIPFHHDLFTSHTLHNPTLHTSQCPQLSTVPPAPENGSVPPPPSNGPLTARKSSLSTPSARALSPNTSPLSWMATDGSRVAATSRPSKATTWDLKPSQKYPPSPSPPLSTQLTTHQILEVCYKSGVKVVTIYAFSIENFKRPLHEVNALMEIAKIKLSQLCQHGELMDRYGANLRVLGCLPLLRQDVLEVIEQATEMTKHNKKSPLPLFPSYNTTNKPQGNPKRLLPLHLPRRNNHRNP